MQPDGADRLWWRYQLTPLSLSHLEVLSHCSYCTMSLKPLIPRALICRYDRQASRCGVLPRFSRWPAP
jgi:hypothetical protein